MTKHAEHASGWEYDAQSCGMYVHKCLCGLSFVTRDDLDRHVRSGGELIEREPSNNLKGCDMRLCKDGGDSHVTKAKGPQTCIYCGKDVTSDPINPSHYKEGNLEVWQAQLIALGKEGYIDYCLGNVIKYVSRHKKKGHPKEDLCKGLWFLEKACGLIDDDSQG